jgi:hypothetical protein
MLVSLVPLTDTPEAQSRSGSERLHLRKHCHNIIIIISTYLITSTITLAIASPRVVYQMSRQPVIANLQNICILKN